MLYVWFFSFLSGHLAAIFHPNDMMKWRPACVLEVIVSLLIGKKMLVVKFELLLPLLLSLCCSLFETVVCHIVGCRNRNKCLLSGMLMFHMCSFLPSFWCSVWSLFSVDSSAPLGRRDCLFAMFIELVVISFQLVYLWVVLVMLVVNVTYLVYQLLCFPADQSPHLAV